MQGNIKNEDRQNARKHQNPNDEQKFHHEKEKINKVTLEDHFT